MAARRGRGIASEGCTARARALSRLPTMAVMVVAAFDPAGTSRTAVSAASIATLKRAIACEQSTSTRVVKTPPLLLPDWHDPRAGATCAFIFAGARAHERGRK
eukprot:5752471-Pleurochrysis_carterae.AAC.1